MNVIENPPSQLRTSHAEREGIESETHASSFHTNLEGTQPIFLLRVTTGDSAGDALSLDWDRSPKILVGSSNACDFLVKDKQVSRRHFSITPEGALLRLADVDSRNGTFVNGLRVTEAFLRGGETIEVGSTTIRVVRAGEAPLPAMTGTSFGRVTGKSLPMQRVFVLAERLKDSMLPLLIEGETGVGKELFAEAIHEMSARSAGPLVSFDRSLAPEQAGDALQSAFEQAHGGTLIIDEPSELPQLAQARLLALISRSTYDVRLICTTKKNLDREVEALRLREELLFRLLGARIELPSLRHRHGDVQMLAELFWREAGGAGALPAEVTSRLSDYHWPGNVRELQHTIERASLLGEQYDMAFRSFKAPEHEQDDLISRILAMDLSLPNARALVVHEFEQRYVGSILKVHGNNVSRAAAASGLTRRYFHTVRTRKKPESNE